MPSQVSRYLALKIASLIVWDDLSKAAADLMEGFSVLLKAIDVVAELFTISASGIAIYLLLFKKQEISAAFQALVGFSFQLSLRDLERRLDDLNRLNASATKHREQVINILSEIDGQSRGNRRLATALGTALVELRDILQKPEGLSEPQKRRLVAELRERIRSAELWVSRPKGERI